MSNLDIPFGFIRDNELFLSAWGTHPDRRIGEIKEDGPEAAVAYFQNKFEDFKGKIEDLTKTIEAAENKGSYLMKLLHLKEQLGVHEGLGDYASLQEKLAGYEQQLSEIIQKNRERNTEIKENLMKEIQEAVQIINWNEATEQVQDIKSRWLKTGNARDDVHAQMEEEFWGHVQGFFDRKKAFYDDKRKLSDARKKKYELLIAEADNLQNLHGKARFDKVKELKAAWETVGNIPAKEYKQLYYLFNNRLKGRKELPPPNFDRIREELDKMFDRQVAVDKDMLQRFRKSLGAFKTREPDMKQKRHDLMQLVNLIWERDFLEGLASKKNKGFQHLGEAQQAAAMSRILKEFIRRDKDDLRQYEENSEKFAGRDPNANRMLERKLGQQRNKIEVKEKLLAILEHLQA